MTQVVFFIAEMIVIVAGILVIRKTEPVWCKVEKSMAKAAKYAGCLCALFAFVMALCFAYEGHDWGGDFSQYLGQAIALHDGMVESQIAHMQFVMDNSIPGMCPAVYPWGLPVLLAVVYHFFGFNLFGFKLIGIISLTLFVYFTYRFLRLRFEVIDAVLACSLIMCCKHFLEASTSILTDIPCAMCSILGLYAMYRMFYTKDKQYLWSVVLSVCALYAYWLRSSGIVLILTLACVHVVIVLGKCNRWIQSQIDKTGFGKLYFVAHITPYFVFVAGKVVMDLVLPKAAGDYLGFADGMPLTYPFANMIYYFNTLQNFFDVGNYLAIVCGVLLFVLIVIGMITNFYKDCISVVYVLGTMAMLFIFPARQGIRYMFAVYPLFLMFALAGMRWILQLLCKKWNKNEASALRLVRYVVLCVAAFMLLFSIRLAVKLHTQENMSSAYTVKAIEAYEYVINNTEEDSVVMFFKPRVLSLNTNRYSYNTYDDPKDLEICDYVFFFMNDNFVNLREHVEKNEDEYELMFDNVHFQIYKHLR